MNLPMPKISAVGYGMLLIWMSSSQVTGCMLFTSLHLLATIESPRFRTRLHNAFRLRRVAPNSGFRGILVDNQSSRCVIRAFHSLELFAKRYVTHTENRSHAFHSSTLIC